MNTLRLKRFTRPDVLRAAGRELVGRFLDNFRPELAAAGAGLTFAGVSDEEYYCALASLLMRAEPCRWQ
jgi:hypothetical protein